MLSLNERLTIDRLGDRGEGIARGREGAILIPYALPGETIIAEVDGRDGRLVEVLAASAERIPPHCRHFSICGGCAVQTLAWEAYARWKQGLAAKALRYAGLTAEVSAVADAHGEGRRRATFHARYDARGEAMVGFMQARSHKIVEMESCPLLAPSMDGALFAARALATALAASGKPLDLLVTATMTGLDIDIRGHGPLNDLQRRGLADLAMRLDLARLSNHGETILTQRAPQLTMGKALVFPPPSAFLQATVAGEEMLAARVCEALKGAKKIADLFAGVGTFGLRLADSAKVHAVDVAGDALKALSRAARSANGLRPVTVEQRDLFHRPFGPQEAEAFDAVLFDPPRAGAQLQARALAASSVPLVAAVSCNIQSFARDAAILCAGGYDLTQVELIDQFRHSPHVEIMALFRRPLAKARRSRRLLG
jgi:23S rRNA (uracil1939-C5)-methyltransferase